MHKTSGRTVSTHSSTLGSRAFSELTFHVATSTRTRIYPGGRSPDSVGVGGAGSR